MYYLAQEFSGRNRSRAEDVQPFLDGARDARDGGGLKRRGRKTMIRFWLWDIYDNGSVQLTVTTEHLLELNYGF